MGDALPRVTRLYPPPSGSWDARAVYEDLPARAFGGKAPQGLPFVAINMVSSVDGKATHMGAGSGIGSRMDRATMRELRSRFDAVLVGANTVRSEKVVMDPLPGTPRPLLAIATASGDIPLEENLPGSNPDNTLILIAGTPEGTSEGRNRRRLSQNATVVRVEGTAKKIEPIGALRALRERFGIESLLLEGGPALNQAALRAGAVREIFLTLAPKILGSTEDPGAAPGVTTVVQSAGDPAGGDSVSSELPADLELISLHSVGHELFFRYRILQSGTSKE